MIYEPPQFVILLRYFAYLGSLIPVLAPFLVGIPIELVQNYLLIVGVVSGVTWLMFWLSVANIMDFCAKSAWHAERLEELHEAASSLRKTDW